MVWGEAVHVLVRTYLMDDLEKVMSDRPNELVHPQAARAILKESLKRYARGGSFQVRSAAHDILKAGSAGFREMLLPYQNSAVASVETFVADSGADVLPVRAESLLRAREICTFTPCDTYDALHLAVALDGGCTYAVTKDADWARIPSNLRPAVVRVA